MKNYVIIFPLLTNVELVKGVGQIPYQLRKKYGYNSSILTYKNRGPYPYLDREVKGLKLIFVEKRRIFLGVDLNIIGRIARDAKNIDILNLFHFNFENFIYGTIYKLLHPKGFLYTIMDLTCGEINGFYSKSRIKNFIKKKLFQFYIRLSDLFSVETSGALKSIIESFAKIKEKVILLPICVDDETIAETYAERKYKENLIITAGRIGSEEKNTEMFLEALKQLELKNWKVAVIGEISDGFKPYIENYFKQNPKMKNILSFTGNIEDRIKLYETYDTAKIFCFTSRHESFGIVIIEAMYFGDYIVSTDVGVLSDLKSKGLGITLVPQENSSELAGALREILNNEKSIGPGMVRNSVFAKEHYVWSKAIERLAERFIEKT